VAKLTLTEIWVYPIKSLGGIRMKSARVLEKGLEHDRRWMLIDKDNDFMSQRLYPKMALFKLDTLDAGFSITHGKDSTFLPFNHPVTNTLVKAVIWDDPVEVFEVSNGHSQWFSKQLGIACKLVSFPENNSRPVDVRYKIKDEQVSLADAYPFLVIGEQSLNDLNSKLKEPVNMNRFRPNFVFSGGGPYEEDSWRNISIGKNKFAVVKPCARCILTTINQETGEKGTEPLATLSTYRKQNNKVHFGQNVLAINHYEIQEGDEITII
jgi:uncharacterized protein